MYICVILVNTYVLVHYTALASPPSSTPMHTQLTFDCMRVEDFDSRGVIHIVGRVWEQD